MARLSERRILGDDSKQWIKQLTIRYTRYLSDFLYGFLLLLELLLLPPLLIPFLQLFSHFNLKFLISTCKFHFFWCSFLGFPLVLQFLLFHFAL